MLKTMPDTIKTIMVLVVIVGLFFGKTTESRTIEATKEIVDENESEDFAKTIESEDTPTDEPESPVGTDATFLLIADMPKRSLKTVSTQDEDSTVAPTVLVPHDSYYAMGSDNIICVAAKFDATLIMTAGTKDGTTVNVSIPFPKNSTYEGSCTDNPTLMISLKMDDMTWVLYLIFNKTEDTWALASVELRVPTEDKSHRETHRAQAKDLESFKGPLGQSLFCQIPHDIVLEDLHKEDNYFIAYLNINNVRMQAFNVPPHYSPAKLCPPHHIRYHSDEAVFVTAGMLGVLAVGVVIGYGIYRGLKSKKVDYGVM